jgi:2-iminobutanoate/2-iminopropanoate deaminase
MSGEARKGGGHGRTEVRSAEAPEPIGPYSQAIAAGDLVFCSGQIGLRGGALVGGGVAAEAEAALLNLRAVLAAAGCEPRHVVKTTIFLVDMGDFGAVNEVYGRLLTEPGCCPPARATVAVAALPKGARVEIDCVAVRSRD